MNKDKEVPWKIGIQAVRANLIPGLFLQSLMLILLLGYYLYPPITDQLNLLSALKNKWGYIYSALSAIIAGAILPEIIKYYLIQKRGSCMTNISNLLFTVPFWGTMGVLVDGFYRIQSLIFGNEATLGIVFYKVICDQLLYSPFIATPLTCWLYDWKLNGYKWNRADWFTVRYIKRVMIPLIIANWGVWIPIVIILYSLPDTLQIPLFGLALSIWVILITWISEKRQVC